MTEEIHPAAHPALAAPPSLPALFWAYFVIGATGFGGSMPWVRRMLVEERRWISADDFNDALSVGQFLPGPNVFNLIVVLGPRFGGLPGIIAAIVGIMAAPFAFSVILGALYAHYGEAPTSKAALRGIAPVAAGLMLMLGLKTAAARQLRGPLVVFTVLTFIAVAAWRVSLPMVLVTLAPFAIATAAWTGRSR